MKLYEVNLAIQSALDRLDFDPETGEIGENTEEVLKELDALEMERDRILEYVAKVALNIRSDAASLKAEEDRLKKRRQALERKEEKLIMILDRECGGEKTDLGFATLTYRKSESLEVLDCAQAVAWLNDNGYSDCIRTPAPEVVKDAVKKLLKKDAKVPGVKLVTNNNCSLK